MKNIINEKQLQNLIREAVKEYIEESVGVHYDSYTVWYDKNNEKFVDTSLSNNPTMSIDYGNDVKIYSLFKRKNGGHFDGNPLLYALKGEGRWHFRNKSDKDKIIQQIHLIVEKFCHMYKADFTILIPSGGTLNRFIGEVIAEYSDDIILSNDVLVKITTEEIWTIVDKHNSVFRRHYNRIIDDAYDQLQGYTDEMDRKRNSYFSHHFVQDPEMRDVLTTTMKLDPHTGKRRSNDINGKDILFIDDTISRGQTIKEAIKIIKDNYTPKSITVLTLFSKVN